MDIEFNAMPALSKLHHHRNGFKQLVSSLPKQRNKKSTSSLFIFRVSQLSSTTFLPIRESSHRKSCHSFIHYGHFYSAPSSPLLLRGATDYSTDTVSEFHAEAHRQL